MNVQSFEISGPLFIELKFFGDARGFFVERYRNDTFSRLPIAQTVVQENFSKSAPGVLRGLHYQYDKPQSKLVTCTMGKIWDVIVDIRKDSPTFGQHLSFVLDADKPSWLWVPVGFAHGFCVMGKEPASLMYKVDNYYNAPGEGGIAWDDSELNIPWPIEKPEISMRDKALPQFSEYKKYPHF